MTPRVDAKKEGRTKYEGKPCMYGHGNLRYTFNGNCVTCRALARARRDYATADKAGVSKTRNRKYTNLIVPAKIQNHKNKYDKKTAAGKWIERSKTGKYRKERKQLLVTDYENIIVKRCPLLNIKLDYENCTSKHMPDNYATLDRINPKLGYVPGNVQIISYKANRIKNSATLKEMKLIVKNWSKM
jgi:hypothetical protein